MSNVAAAVAAQQARRAQHGSFEPTDLTKYFTIALDKNVQRGEKIFRILPPLPGQESPFVEIYFHVVEVGGNRRKLYDPGKNEGKPSPLNEVGKALKATGDPADKKLASKFSPRLFYVIKGIERGKESEGVKFWRFPHDFKGAGVFDQLTILFQRYGDITDPLTGFDISINLTKVKDPRGTEYTDITSILPMPVSPLSVDADLAKQWIEDPMTWEAVYKKYDHEYLLLIAEGRIPMWSETENKWVAKPETDVTTSTTSSANITDAIPGAPTGAIPSAPVADAGVVAQGHEEVHIPDDDLPF